MMSIFSFNHVVQACMALLRSACNLSVHLLQIKHMPDSHWNNQGRKSWHRWRRGRYKTLEIFRKLNQSTATSKNSCFDLKMNSFVKLSPRFYKFFQILFNEIDFLLCRGRGGNPGGSNFCSESSRAEATDSSLARFSLLLCKTFN